MGNLKKSDLIEAVFWLALAGIFFAVTYDFNQQIEIYKFGATGWPRTILLLMVLVALGNVFYTLRHGGKALKSRVGASEEPDQIEYRGLRDYLKTGFILLLPFAYLMSYLNHAISIPKYYSFMCDSFLFALRIPLLLQ